MHFRKIPLLKTILKNSKISNNNKKKRNQKFSSDNSETYNQPFSLSELKDALSKAHDSSPGPDDIHYQFLKHLPDTSLSVRLKTFNDIWETGNVPKSWKEATIIPIPKPGKDNTNPNNYRPIALTSCICKTLERMINERLVWYLEKNNIITEFQSGFRHQRSTNDHLVRLETFIREAFIKKEHLVAVFLAHLSHRLRVSYCHWPMSVVRRPSCVVNNCFKQHLL